MRKPLILSLMLCVAACGGGEEKRDRPAPLVTLGAATQHVFSDRYVAVGTANANEQVSVRAPVTERITQLGFSDGDYVRQGQMLAVLAQGQEKASLASAQARAREADQQLARISELHRRGFATNANLEAQTASAASAKAAYRSRFILSFAPTIARSRRKKQRTLGIASSRRLLSATVRSSAASR